MEVTIRACAEKVIARLRSCGYEAWLVGGSVRDLMMGREPKDVDITTNATPEQTKTVFSGFRLIETGLKHGTVTVLIEGEPVEITTYRLDGVYSDHRRPDGVTYTQNLRDDLSRRDFTVNAMAYAPGVGLVDSFGGADDLREGVIRCVGEPERRFDEDGLRVLRALRFASVLGFSIEPRTAQALRQKKELLRYVSPERVLIEINKLLCGKAVREILLSFADVLCAPLPEIAPMIGFEQKNRHHCFDVWRHTVEVVACVPPVPVLRWAALLHDIGKPSRFFIGDDGEGHFYGHAAASEKIAAEIARRLRFDNATRDRLLMLVKHHDTPIMPEAKLIKRALNRFGEEAFVQMIALARADNLGQAEAYRGRQTQLDAAESLMRELACECFTLSSLAVKGEDLMALGYRGKQIGQALNLLLDAVIDGRVVNQKCELLMYLEARA